VGSDRMWPGSRRFDGLGRMVVGALGGEPGSSGRFPRRHLCSLRIGDRGDAPRVPSVEVATATRRRRHHRSWPTALRRGLVRPFLDSEDEGIRAGVAGGRRSSIGHNQRSRTIMHRFGDWLHQHAGYWNRLRALRRRSWSAQWTPGQLCSSQCLIGNGVALHALWLRRPNALGRVSLSPGRPLVASRLAERELPSRLDVHTGPVRASPSGSFGEHCLRGAAPGHRPGDRWWWELLLVAIWFEVRKSCRARGHSGHPDSPG
jgi:hypothetical protein